VLYKSKAVSSTKGAQLTDYKEMWDKAQNFTDFLNLNQQYDSETNEWIHPLGAPGPTINPRTRKILSDLGLFVYDTGEYFEDGIVEDRPYVSFWCPEASKPSELITKLQDRTDVIVCATKLHPFEVVKGTVADRIYITRLLTRDAGIEDDDLQTVEPQDLSQKIEFWRLDNVRLLRPCLIDLVAADYKKTDLVSKLQETIHQCNWRNA
jgi:hypothetical protein